MTTIGIEDLVRWAWLDELPKVAPTGRFRAPAALGYVNTWAATVGLSHQCRSGSLNHFGAVFDPAATGEPHPDALAVASAVARLDDMVIVEPSDVDWFGRWGDLGRLGEVAVSRAWSLVVRAERHDGKIGDGVILQGLASTIVVRASILDRWPDWRGDAPVVVPDLHPGGRPKWVRLVDRAVAWDGEGNPVRFEKVEVDGFNRTTQRPFAGAWQANRLDPDPTPVLAERIRWAMLHAWMSALAAALDGIGGRVVLPPARPDTPWIG